MRLARIRHHDTIWLARVEGDQAVPLHAESSHPAADAVREALACGVELTGSAEPPVALDSVELLAPLKNPSKILAIGLNYADHARESGTEPPTAPLVFAKAPSSIVGPGEAINWDADDSSQVDYEVELAVVIGRRTERSTTDPLTHVLGYTIANDVSARDAQFSDGQWVRGKSFDTFCPLGPWIVTTDEIPDPQRLDISCDVNGVQLQRSSTAEMIFPVADLVTYLSRFMTLEPGDLILTGTPWGVGFARTPPVHLRAGDEVSCSIGGVGQLINPVKAA